MTDLASTGLVLIGGGGHCRSCVDVIESAGELQILGIVDRESARSKSVLEYPVLGDDDALPQLLERASLALVTVGQIRSPETRIRLYDRLVEIGFHMPIIASPNAYVSPRATLGQGTIVHHGAVVNAGAKIGVNGIVNSLALVEHDVTIASHCHLSTGSRINGGATIGSGTFVGSGAVIGHERQIGSNCVIAAGAIVLSDLADGTWVRQDR